jgi:hypothetical protein
MEGIPLRGKTLDIHWSSADGLVIHLNGERFLHNTAYRPGDLPVALPQMPTLE